MLERQCISGTPLNPQNKPPKQEEERLRGAGPCQGLSCVHDAGVPCISKATEPLVMKLWLGIQ